MKRGSDFERELQAANDYYRATGQATLWQIHTGTTYSRKRRKMIFTKKVAGDFFGYLPGGRAVLLEAKSTEKDVWYQGKMRPHQYDELKAAHEAGCLVGVAIRFGTFPVVVCHVLDFGTFEGFLKAKKGKIRMEWPSWRTYAPEIHGGGWDWLNSLLRGEKGPKTLTASTQ